MMQATAMDETVPAKRSILKDWGYYSLWWAIVLGGLNVLTYVVGGPAEQLWSAKLQHLLFGVSYGLICAFVFTVVQNILNVKRSKVLSCLFVVVIWIALMAAKMLAVGVI